MRIIEQQLLLTSKSGRQIVGKITGNIESNRIAVFVHGFGVMSDSRKTYTEISKSFEEKILSVRFHLVSVDTFNNEIYTPGFDEQTEILKTVLDSVIMKFSGKEIILIAHSQGCYVVGKLLKESDYDLNKVILLSPLIREDIGRKLVEKFSKREGSIVNISGLSRFVRTDGTITLIPSEFWIQAKKINSIELFKYLDSNYDTYFVWTKGDITTKSNEYVQLKKQTFMKYFEIEGDHDYRNNGNIDELIKFLKTVL